MSTIVKSLFKHGGSFAVDVPMEFARRVSSRTVIMEDAGDALILRGRTALNNLESEPEFTRFIRALAADALKHPAKLKEAKNVWDKEWDELLRGVTEDE